MQNQDLIWELIAKKLAGEASPEELKQLDELLQQHPNASYPMELLTHMWKQEAPDTTAAAEQAFNKHLDKWAQLKSDRQYAQQKNEQATASDRRKPGLIYSFFNSNGVANHYFKLIWRGLMRSKSFSFINITGLAIGMAAAILIFLWIRNELTMDRFHSKGDRVYLILNRAKFADGVDVWAATPSPLGPELKDRFPDAIEEAVRFSWVAAFVLKRGEQVVQTEGLLVDPGFLRTYDFPLRDGDVNTAMNDSNSIVITERLAREFFGHPDAAMGQTLLIDSNDVFTVKGVLKPLPSNTSFSFEYLVPFSYKKKVGWEKADWRENNSMTTVLLKPGVTEERANQLFGNVIKTHVNDRNTELIVHPIKKWWLWNNFKDGVASPGHLSDVRMFIIIAVFILLIACINYMNLSTARSDKRSREVGISKVVGAGKASLVGRFMGESVLLSFFAGIIAIILVQLSLGWFNDLVEKRLSIPFGSLSFWVWGLAFIAFTGIIAGSYPAFYLSGFKPIRVLQRSFKKAHTLVAPRKILVVLQFSFAILLIICTIIIYRQIIYGQKRDPGYKQDNLAFVYVKGDMIKNFEAIKKDLFAKNLITDITRTSSPVTDVWSGDDRYKWNGKDTTIRTGFSQFEAEDRFVSMHGFNMILGRDFNKKQYPGDSSALILTQLAVQRMGFSDPIGQIVNYQGRDWHVIGVIKDFIPEAPYSPAFPIIIHYQFKGFGSINFKLNPALSNKEARIAISDVFRKHNPGYVVEYRVVKQEYAMKFAGEIKVATMAALFAGLTIFISCMGLFALSTYMAESRIKEIGVRKVLGASVTNITTLLSKEFIKLVTISFVIASPIAWWAMNNWLKEYSYRVSISWWVFVLTGILSLFIVAATVGYQAVKAAMTNPAKSLRND
jgi:putative ABC transport system permease protein